jgi:hypothetical protein
MSTNGIGQLIAALAKAQAKFEVPRKTKVAEIRSEKGKYQYHYSDLADLIAAVRGPLSENELAFSHCLVAAERGTMVRAILAHSSGEMLQSEYTLPHYQRPQEFGSALTYARRYTLSSLLGVAADDDDDGEAAAHPEQRQPQARAPQSTDDPGPASRSDHPRKAEAEDAYKRIRLAIQHAGTPNMIDELIKANSDSFLPLIKEVSEAHYDRLMTLANARKQELYASA